MRQYFMKNGKENMKKIINKIKFYFFKRKNKNKDYLY